eukprot:TRINITY_DN1064_c0_g1_i24.p1 TRINITY_DN1064_c0_g1~~TRINITY_DN1064_c0_g1_i24.p1  ORF type:complete len:220 (+),score=29.21 TRINITY_DN1064_c0_g1_i24:91-750(+)
MKGPVHVYYELNNFYQNHRQYAKSISKDQLKDDGLDLSDCKPVRYVGDLDERNRVGITNLGDVAYPCGLIANSHFTDAIQFFSLNGNNIQLYSDVAWSDDDKLYKKTGIQWVDIDDPHFRVWMRIAGLPTFRKHWYIIRQDLEPGEYTVTFSKSDYNVNEFDGKKFIVLSTTNAFGGKNYFLGWFFIGTAIVSVVLCVVFLVGYVRNQYKDTAVYVSRS